MLITAERVVLNGTPLPDIGIVVGNDGRIRAIDVMGKLGEPDVNLVGRVLLPGFVNAHSHAFQRVLRGRTQVASGSDDNFWTWREAMYLAAQRLDPESLYVVARQAFVEMVLNGITAVGEFHYLHYQPDGKPYEDGGIMAEALCRAALDVGIRICLLRVVYLRSDFEHPPEPMQRRFSDPNIDTAWVHMERLVGKLLKYNDPRLSWGMAAHSLRAVPIEGLVSLKACAGHLPMHVHASEQLREVERCQQVYGTTPIALMARAGVLDAQTTVVHATHLRPGEAEAMAKTGTMVCVCPSTEEDLGDGLVPAQTLQAAGVQMSLGTDGQTLSSVLEEARRLEMHERLRTQRRNVLTRKPGESVAREMLRAATIHGARSLDILAGNIEMGRWADFVAYNLYDPHLAGVDDSSLLAAIVFSADSRAIYDVFVGGHHIVSEGFHTLAPQAAEEFRHVSRELFLS